MSYDSEDGVAQWLMGEAARALPDIVTKIVDPWVRLTAQEVVEGKALSSSPTRGGEHVQVRFRLGTRMAASSHPLQFLRDSRMEFIQPSLVSPLIRVGVTFAVIRPDKIEQRVRTRLRDRLQDACKSIPPEVVARSRVKAGGSFSMAYQGEIWRMASSFVQTLKVDSRVLSSPGVLPAMEALIVRASELAVSVPHHLFPDSGRKLKHETAKRRLLKAMKVALLAGVTDAELEEIKNEALVNQIMS
jgi:hypothetical protein